MVNWLLLQTYSTFAEVSWRPNGALKHIDAIEGIRMLCRILRSPKATHWIDDLAQFSAWSVALQIHATSYNVVHYSSLNNV